MTLKADIQSMVFYLLLKTNLLFNRRLLSFTCPRVKIRFSFSNRIDFRLMTMHSPKRGVLFLTFENLKNALSTKNDWRELL